MLIDPKIIFTAESTDRKVTQRMSSDFGIFLAIVFATHLKPKVLRHRD